MHGIRNLKRLKTKLHRPIEIIACAITPNFLAGRSTEQSVNGLVEQLPLQIPQSQINRTLRAGRQPQRPMPFGSSPHHIIEMLCRKTIAALQQGRVKSINQCSNRFAKSRSPKAPCAILSRYFNPHASPANTRRLARHIWWKLRIFIHRQTNRRRKPPARTACGCYRFLLWNGNIHSFNRFDLHNSSCSCVEQIKKNENRNPSPHNTTHQNLRHRVYPQYESRPRSHPCRNNCPPTTTAI